MNGSKEHNVEKIIELTCFEWKLIDNTGFLKRVFAMAKWFRKRYNINSDKVIMDYYYAEKHDKYNKQIIDKKHRIITVKFIFKIKTINEETKTS